MSITFSIVAKISSEILEFINFCKFSIVDEFASEILLVVKKANKYSTFWAQETLPRAIKLSH